MTGEKKFKYSYTIYNAPDEALFKRQCAALEKHIPGLRRDRLYEDVDMSAYQCYFHEKGEVRVCNDYYVGCLRVDSDFDLTKYFTAE